MRKVIYAEVGGHRLFGTFHVPSDVDVAADEHEMRFSCAGVVLFNFGHAARSAVGDLAALIGDRLAECNSPVFRFDMPGLGDSPGHLPEFEDDIFRHIQSGGDAEIATDIIADIQARFSLDRLILGGLCGGAITAMCAAELAKVDVEGIIALDPDFSLVTDISSGEAKTPGVVDRVISKSRRLIDRLLAPQSWFRLLSGDTKYWVRLRRLRLWLLGLVGQMMNRRLLPRTNKMLVATYKRLNKRGIPILAMTVSGKPRDAYFQQVQRALFEGAPSPSVSWISVPNTNHVFMAGGARDLVIAETTRWVRSLDSVSNGNVVQSDLTAGDGDRISAEIGGN